MLRRLHLRVSQHQSEKTWAKATWQILREICGDLTLFPEIWAVRSPINLLLQTRTKLASVAISVRIFACREPIIRASAAVTLADGAICVFWFFMTASVSGPSIGTG